MWVFLFFFSVMPAVLPLQNEDDFGVGFVDLMQSHHIRVCLGRLKHGDLIQDVHAAVLALPSLSQELGSILLPCCFFNALLHHRKLSPGKQRRERARE